ncbi:MAG TPA: COX15/CtaA family protein [Steroidobacteraceae bacterium]|nr:COX15/CtaA family protein [Steroidobacteraceae bacterium]
MPETRNLLWFRRAALAATLLCAIVVVVGAWVRLTNAGLGCPDWPGCYGHAHPAQAAERIAEINAANPGRPFDYQKAINEMVHRYIVGALGVVVIGLAVLSVMNRRDPAQPRVLPWMLVGLLVVQALLGMWTVTLLLKPLIVTLHLIGGLFTLALLWWLALPPARRELKAAERPLRRLAIAGLAVLLVQVALGGWTSTNYAAAACPDFPTCQGSWWPPMDFRNAFILWRGLGIDYEGGVLDAPARVAIHYTHRLGAIATAFVFAILAAGALRRGQSRATRFAACAVGVALVIQLAIGMNLVLKGWPLSLGTAHNAGAALLMLAAVALLRSLSPRSEVGRYRPTLR